MTWVFSNLASQGKSIDKYQIEFQISKSMLETVLPVMVILQPYTTMKIKFTFVMPEVKLG